MGFKSLRPSFLFSYFLSAPARLVEQLTGCCSCRIGAEDCDCREPVFSAYWLEMGLCIERLTSLRPTASLALPMCRVANDRAFTAVFFSDRLTHSNPTWRRKRRSVLPSGQAQMDTNGLQNRIQRLGPGVGFEARVSSEGEGVGNRLSKFRGSLWFLLSLVQIGWLKWSD